MTAAGDLAGDPYLDDAVEPTRHAQFYLHYKPYDDDADHGVNVCCNKSSGLPARGAILLALHAAG